MDDNTAIFITVSLVAIFLLGVVGFVAQCQVNENITNKIIQPCAVPTPQPEQKKQ